MKVSIIGLGYWGPNLLRSFKTLGVLDSAFDLDPTKVAKFSKDPVYKDVYFGTDWKKCLSRADVDAVVVATPPNTHYKIAMEAMAAGKHLFIEKPITLEVEEGEKIVELAKQKDLIVMVGHIFLYSPEIIKLKEIISAEAFGTVQYLYTKRLNLGKLQSPANVIDDLAPHDISIIDYLLGIRCNAAQAVAKAHVLDTEDVAFINLKYGDILCSLHLSWLDPLKVRDTIVVGTKQMVVCDSMFKKIHLYNKGVDIQNIENNMDTYANHLLTYRYGDEIVPYIPATEPLKTECQEFIDCVEEHRTPLSSGPAAVEVVRVLEAIQKSIRLGGGWIEL